MAIEKGINKFTRKGHKGIQANLTTISVPKRIWEEAFKKHFSKS